MMTSIWLISIDSSSSTPVMIFCLNSFRLFVKIIGGHRVPICSKVQHILFDRIYGICNQNMETQARWRKVSRDIV